MTDFIFSTCKRIVGKDKTKVTLENGRTMEKWALSKNRFTNYPMSVPAEDEHGNVVLTPTGRQQAVKLIAHHGYATAYVLKDDTLKKERSKGANTLGARMFMVDFDNTWSLEEAMQHPWWSKVWFAYTTPSYGATQEPVPESEAVKLPSNQLEAINAQVGQAKRNFRLVFRLHRLISRVELLDVAAGMMSVFPLADQSCVDDARIFFGAVKARVELPVDEYHLTELDIEHLKALAGPWREANKKEVHQRIERHTSTSQVATGDFNGDTTITLADGVSWTVRDLFDKPLGWKDACYSIFRMETNPSAFVTRQQNGDIFTFDSGSRLKKTFRAEDILDTVLTFKKKVSKTAEQVEEPKEVNPEITMVDVVRKPRAPGYTADYKPALTVEERRAQIKSTARALQRFNIFFAPEGFGKSFITMALTSKLRKVLFCTATNEQAELKAEEFRQLRVKQPGFPHLTKPKVQCCVSRDYLFKKATGVAVVKKDSVDPFEAPVSNKVETIEKTVAYFQCTVEEAHTIWKDEHDGAAVENPDFGAFDIIVTTMSRAEIIAQSSMYRSMSDEWVVIYDDPGFADVSNLIKHSEAREARLIAENERRAEKKLAPIELQKVAFEDRLYWVRPADKRLGQNFHPFINQEGNEITVPVIYTTTEELTRHLIEAFGDVRVFDYMHDLHVENVTLWGTSLVHAKNDGLIILAAELLQYAHPDEPISLIGDGLGQQLNHVNNKGQNSLSSRHLIIELSQLHPTRRAQLVDEVTHIAGDATLTDRDVQTIYMRDQMHQAIGRNSGYRERPGDYQTVVLCDPDYYASLNTTCRYMLAPWSGQLDALTGSSGRTAVAKRKRTRSIISYHGAMPTMLGELQRFITAPSVIFANADISNAVLNIAKRSPQAKARLFKALSTQIEQNKVQNELLEGLIRLLA